MADNGKTGWAEQSGKALAVGIGAAAGLPLGPAGVVGGAVAGSLLEQPAVRMLQRIGQAILSRQQKVADVACETADLSSEELFARISDDEELQVLFVEAMDAARRTAWEPKLLALGSTLASGVLSSDKARFSTEKLIMAAVADMEESHLALLDLCVAWHLVNSGRETSPIRLDIPGYSHSQITGKMWSAGRRQWYLRAIQTYRPGLTPVFSAVVGVLQGHGLVSYVSNVEGPGAILDSSPNPGPFVEPTELGELVWLRFDKAGANVSDGWVAPASGPAG